MERRPEPHDYENNPGKGWTEQSKSLALLCFLLSVGGLLLVAWISKG